MRRQHTDLEHTSFCIQYFKLVSSIFVRVSSDEHDCGFFFLLSAFSFLISHGGKAKENH